MVKKAAQATPNRPLKAARKERGWTQQEVADRIGAPLALNVSRWESGTAFPSAYYLQKLCHLFGKSAGELGLSQVETEVVESGIAPAPPGERASSPANPQIWMLPYPRNLFFLGREDVLAHLRQRLQAGQTLALSQPQAINGLGGVGKTQVALEYAYRSAQDYQAVFWIRADSHDALVAGFLEMAHALHLPEQDEQDHTAIVAAVKGWFSQHTSWLLILDNADDLSLLPEFFPSPVQGHLLLTTRAQALGRLANRIEVDTLDTDTAALLLLRRAGLLAIDAPLAQAEPTELRVAMQLSEELGGLPLALDQAGAYLEETRCGLQQYLDLYRSHRADLLRHRGGLVQDHPDSVATTWALSFAAIEQQSALAADVLRLCAWLHPDAIPEELFLQGAAYLGPLLSPLEADPLAFNQALAVIQGYSLLRRTSREQMLSVHRLVQAVLQDAMRPQERSLWRERAITVLNALFPNVWRHLRGQWEQCSRLLPHVLIVAAATPPEQDSLELASLLSKAADYLFQRAQYAQGEPLYQRALSMYEQMLGSEHHQVAAPLNGLADLYREQGRYAEAEALYQRALHLWERLHQDHPEMYSPLNNMALLYWKQGRYEEAEALLQRALHLDTQAVSQEDSPISSFLNNLAILYCEQGRYEEAEPLLQRALHLDTQRYGQDHPETSYSLNNLACVYQEQGRFAEAETLFQHALRIREQTLGQQHPEVAQTLHDLANLYREQGHYKEAEALYQRALTIRRQQRGAQHPDTAETLHGFARLYEAQNQPDQALTCYQQALAIREQQLGSAHPRTLDTRARYAHLLQACGRPEETTALEETSAAQQAARSGPPSAAFQPTQH
jgi:tetratricopeptide (TPR) repeat protein/transcriptional regulator with XRE-family HTH domain